MFSLCFGDNYIQANPVVIDLMLIGYVFYSMFFVQPITVGFFRKVLCFYKGWLPFCDVFWSSVCESARDSGLESCRLMVSDFLKDAPPPEDTVLILLKPF